MEDEETEEEPSSSSEEEEEEEEGEEGAGKRKAAATRKRRSTRGGTPVFGKGEGKLLACSSEGCGKWFHMGCLDPPLSKVRGGERERQREETRENMERTVLTVFHPCVAAGQCLWQAGRLGGLV